MYDLSRPAYVKYLFDRIVALFKNLANETDEAKKTEKTMVIKSMVFEFCELHTGNKEEAEEIFSDLIQWVEMPQLEDEELRQRQEKLRQRQEELRQWEEKLRQWKEVDQKLNELLADESGNPERQKEIDILRARWEALKNESSSFE